MKSFLSYDGLQYYDEKLKNYITTEAKDGFYKKDEITGEDVSIGEAIKRLEDNQNLFWMGTQSEYDIAVEEGKITDKTFVIITDADETTLEPVSNAEIIDIFNQGGN